MVSNAMTTSFDDDLFCIRLHEQYQHILAHWRRTDISIPSFTQWQYAIKVGFEAQRGLHGRLSDSEIFTVLETFILHMSRANLSLVADSDKGDQTASANHGAKVVASLFAMGEKYEKKLADVFQHYIEKPQQKLDWRDFGAQPEVRTSMVAVLKTELSRTESALTNGSISFDHAIGRIEGATSILYRSGACDELTVNTIVSDWRRRRSMDSKLSKPVKEKSKFLTKILG